MKNPVIQVFRVLLGLVMAGLFSTANAQGAPYDPHSWTCGHVQKTDAPAMAQYDTCLVNAPNRYMHLNPPWSLKYQKRIEHPIPVLFTDFIQYRYCRKDDTYNASTNKCIPRACPAGQELVNGVCEDTGTCKAGKKAGIEFKIGWAHYFNDPDTGANPLNNGTASVTPIPPQSELPLDVCYQGCFHYYDGNERYWVDSTEILNGVVPRFGSADYVSSEMECTQPLDTDLAGPLPENPPPPDDDDGEPGGGDDDDDNPEGEEPGGGRGPQDDRDNNPGGDDDDPGDDPNNGPGGGNNQNPAEQQCGVAGKPACTSKIDETGTPSGPGDKMDTGKLGTEFDKLRNQLDRIGDKSTKDTSWGVVPSWFSTSGGCAPLNLGSAGPINFTIDHCPAVPFAKGAASFMWLVITFFAVTGMVSRTLGAGARS